MNSESVARAGIPGRRWLVCGVAAAALLAVLLPGCRSQGKNGDSACETDRAATSPSEPALTPEQQQTNLASFDIVWETVRDQHWDPDLGGVDWDAVRDELRPRVAAATSMSAARRAMRAALARLEQSHFGILPHEVYEKMESPREAGDGDAGLTVRVVDGRAIVTDVREGSSAEQAGVRPGFELEEIEGEKLAPMLERIAETYTDSTLRELMLSRTVEAHLSGAVGEAAQVEFVGDGDRPIMQAIRRDEPRGKRVSIGHLPISYLRFESRRLESNVGYVTFNIFLDPQNLMSQFEDAVRSFMDADGIILDLRGNPGGIGGMAMGMAGWFIEHTDQPLGTMRTRQMQLKFVVFSRAETYDGPLAVLVDGCTGSTSEILAGGLQALGRARIFGTRSAGAALPSQIVKLPNKDGFQYAIADYVTSNGDRLEGVGVIPDVEVRPQREALLAGHDPVIDAATAWIQSRKQR